ncbi:hypothetical protein QJQ45_007088 [Haematococcus lacustris]|nr:hypothetical protein QJQ45_007088 [Haematococcus lacustris]
MSANWLYHEKQVAALCGVHCLNTLLQGPYFSELDLAQIGQELDRLESELLLGGAKAAGEAGNVDGSGMFSIQVLSRALQVWSLSASPITSPDMAGVSQEPQRERAFICNLQEHWFTIRRVGQDWFDFNSTFPAPQALGTFYLAAFLASLRDQGFTIYVVRGNLPTPQPPQGGGSQGPGHWFTIDQAKALNADAAAARQRGKVLNTLDGLFSKAAQQGGSLTLRSKRPLPASNGHDSSDGGGVVEGMAGFPGGEDFEDAELAAAIAASLQGHQGAAARGPGSQGVDDQGASSGSGGGPSSSHHVRGQPGAGGGVVSRFPGSAEEGWGGPRGVRQRGEGAGGWEGQEQQGGEGGEEEEEDLQLAAAIAASLEAVQPMQQSQQEVQQEQQQQQQQQQLAAEPEPGEGVVELALRLPDGSRVSRRFTTTDPASTLYSYLAAHHQLAAARYTVATQFPRKVIACDPGAGSFAEEKLVDMLELGLAKYRVKEDIVADLEKRKANVRQIGEEPGSGRLVSCGAAWWRPLLCQLAEQLGKDVELNKMRMDLATSASLADTLAQFQELDDSIQALRDELQEDAAELAAYEASSAAARNQGLFFQNLHQAVPLKEGELGYNRQAAQSAAQMVKVPAVKEVHSPLRLYVFTYLTIVLGCVVAADLTGGTPSLGLDALYVALGGVLGFNAWNERAALERHMDEKEAEMRESATEKEGSSAGWSKKAEYRDGGFRHAPIAKDKLDGPAEEQAALPRRARSAWECYADELFQKADKQVANKKEDAAFKSSIRDQVMPKRKKARWSTQEQHEAEPGLWSQLSVEQQAPYIAAAAADKERYKREMEAYWAAHPEAYEQHKARKAVRKGTGQAGVKGRKASGKHKAAGGSGSEGDSDGSGASSDDSSGAVVPVAAAKRGAAKSGKAVAKATARPAAAKAAGKPAGKPSRKAAKVEEEEEAEEDGSEEEEGGEEYVSESSDDEDHLDSEEEAPGVVEEGRQEEEEEEAVVPPAAAKPAVKAAAKPKGAAGSKAAGKAVVGGKAAGGKAAGATASPAVATKPKAAGKKAAESAAGKAGQPATQPPLGKRGRSEGQQGPQSKQAKQPNGKQQAKRGKEEEQEEEQEEEEVPPRQAKRAKANGAAPVPATATAKPGRAAAPNPSSVAESSKVVKNAKAKPGSGKKTAPKQALSEVAAEPSRSAAAPTRKTRGSAGK